MQENCKNKLNIISSVYIYLMLTVFLIFMPKGFYVGLTFAKFLFFAISAATYLVFIIVTRLFYAFNGYGFAGSFARTSWAQMSFVVFILVMMVSSALSPYRDNILMGSGRYEGILTWVLYIFVFIALSRYSKLTSNHILAFAGTICLISIISIIQYFGINILYPAGADFASSKFLGTIGNINMLSGLLCIAIPIFIAAFIRLKNKKRWFLLPAIFLGLLTLLLSEVDSGKVGILVVLVLFIPLMIKSIENLERSTIVFITLSAAGLLKTVISKQEQAFMTTGTFWFYFAVFLLSLIAAIVVYTWGDNMKTKSSKRLAAILMTLIAIGGMFFVIVNPTHAKQGMVYEMNQVTKGNLDDSFGSNRMFLWKRTMQLVAERPSFGTGPDSFRWAFADSFSKDVKQIDKKIYYDNAHNEYLQITVNYGFIGLFVYLVSIWLALYYNKEKYKNPVLGSSYYGVICYLIQAIFSFSIIIVAPIFWIMLAACDSESIEWAPEPVLESQWPKIDSTVSKEEESVLATEETAVQKAEVVSETLAEEIQKEKTTETIETEEKPTEVELEKQQPASDHKEEIKEKEEPDPYEILGLTRWKRK